MNEQHKKAIDIAQALAKVPGTEKWHFKLCSFIGGMNSTSVCVMHESQLDDMGTIYVDFEVHGPWLPVDDFGTQCCVKWFKSCLDVIGLHDHPFKLKGNVDLMRLILDYKDIDNGKCWKAGQKAIGVE